MVYVNKVKNYASNRPMLLEEMRKYPRVRAKLILWCHCAVAFDEHKEATDHELQLLFGILLYAYHQYKRDCKHRRLCEKARSTAYAELCARKLAVKFPM